MLTTLQKPYYYSLAKAVLEKITSGNYDGDYIPAEIELCNEYKVSRITVRKALKSLEDNGVLKATQGKRRKISINKIKVKKTETQMEIISIAAETLPCYSIMNNTINIEAHRHDFSSTSFIAERKTGLDKFKKYFINRRILGIICIGIPQLKQIQVIEDIGLPVVYAGYNHPKVEDSVVTDNFMGGYIAAEHLIKNGHKNTLLINSLRNSDLAFTERERGFAEAMQEYGSQFKCYREMTSSRKIGDRGKLLKLLTETQKPTAIFSTTDLNIPILFSFMKENNIYPIEDVSIVGYDNMINVFELARENIDSIEQPWEQIAKRAFERLVEKIENPGATPGQTLYIKPKLIKKGTVKQIMEL